MGVDTRGMGEQEAALAGIKKIEQLRREIGIPHRIREIGATELQLQSFAEKTMKIQRLLWLNPRRASYDDILGILQDAF